MAVDSEKEKIQQKSFIAGLINGIVRIIVINDISLSNSDKWDNLNHFSSRKTLKCEINYLLIRLSNKAFWIYLWIILRLFQLLGHPEGRPLQECWL